MAEKKIITYNARLVHKHDLSENWNKAEGFIPLQGEIIIYDDLNKIKIGDGQTKVTDLPFYTGLFDMVDLPKEKDASSEVIYRRLEGKFIFNRMISNESVCYIREDSDFLQEGAGQNIIVKNENGTLGYVGYYSVSDNMVYGYVNKEEIKTALDYNNLNSTDKAKLDALLLVTSNGWKPLDQLANTLLGQSINLKWGKVIASLDEAVDPEALYLYLIENLYHFKNNLWISQDAGIGMPGSAIGAEIFNSLENIASGKASHGEGFWTVAEGDYSHAEGLSAIATGNSAHAEGDHTEASGSSSHAEGSGTTAIGDNSHTEGNTTFANSIGAHAEGGSTKAVQAWAHAEGYGTTASGNSSHTEGQNTAASGIAAHAEGTQTEASADYSHAEGAFTNASGQSAHAEGESTKATAHTAHAEGYDTEASGMCAHVEGVQSIASGVGAHAEGGHTKAGEAWAHAEGYNTIANGNSSHASGLWTIASADAQTVIGKYNINDNTKAFIVGNGTYLDNRSNAMTVDWNGNAEFAGNITSNGDLVVTETDIEDVYRKGPGITMVGPEQMAIGRYNQFDAEKAFVIGNGYMDGKWVISHNAHTVDWDGNAWYNGEIRVGGENYGDENAQIVATENYVDNAYSAKDDGGILLEDGKFFIDPNFTAIYVSANDKNNRNGLLSSTDKQNIDLAHKILMESFNTQASNRPMGLYKFGTTSYGFVKDIQPIVAEDLAANGIQINSNTAGASQTTDKIYIVGASKQDITSSTYTNNNAYISNGAVYSNNTKVSVEGHTHAYSPSSHTHMISLGAYEDSTNSVNLEFGQNYLLQAGGQGLTFQMPSTTASLARDGLMASTYYTYLVTHGHSYAGSDEVGGAANSAKKVQGSLTFIGSGLGDGINSTFDGSVSKTISYNTIGAAASDHNHDSKYAEKDHLHDGVYAYYDHTHLYAGSSSAGGSATSAVKLDSNAGSVTQPVYFTGGKPTACTYSLSKSVPSDAQFTDTKNTAGSSDTSSKIYLIGAPQQDAYYQTYTHDTAYVDTDGCLYSGGAKVLTSHQSLSNYSTLANTIKALSISGKTITYTKGNNSTGTLTTQDTTYSAGTGLKLNGTTFSLDNGYYVTTTSSGLMSAADKTKLDGIAVGANNYSHPATHAASMITGLAVVATSGSYNDLSNKPSIPTIGTGSTNAAAGNHTHGTSISSTTDLATVNLTHGGSYKLTAGGTTTIFSMPSVTKNDVTTALGYTPPTTDTTYTIANRATTGLMSSGYYAYLMDHTHSYAASDHTHTVSIAADSGTNQLTLAHGTKYKLTAGGKSFVFTMPSDNNTTYSAASGGGLSLSGTVFSANTSYTSSGKNYAVKVDSTSGGLYVNVPWTDNNTTYESKSAASGGTAVSLVTTGEKYTWNNKASTSVATRTANGLMASGYYSYLMDHTHSGYAASDHSHSGYASSGHTHTTSIATSTGTNQLTLGFGSKYALTAGGTSYIFTMPSLGTGSSQAAKGDHTHSQYLTSHQSLANYSTLANTIKSLSISGKTITYTKGDGTTGTLTTQDTNTTYGAGTGISLNGTTFSLNLGYYATSTNNGLMSAADKTKLDGIAVGATAITIGTGSTQAAAGNHTHSGYISSSPSSLTITGAAASSSNPKNLFIIKANTVNKFRVQDNGDVFGKQYYTSGADYAEYMEWQDQNLNKEDRRGYFVTLVDDCETIKIAKSNDDVIGVVSSTPSVIGNDATFYWSKMYMTDVYGETLFEEVKYPETTDEEGNVIPAHTEMEPMLNPEYDPTREYIPRSQRPEWAAIGMLGQLVVRDDGTCKVGKYCKCNDNGIATIAEGRNGWRVLKRLDEHHIKILFK